MIFGSRASGKTTKLLNQIEADTTAFDIILLAMNANEAKRLTALLQKRPRCAKRLAAVPPTLRVVPVTQPLLPVNIQTRYYADEGEALTIYLLNKLNQEELLEALISHPIVNSTWTEPHAYLGWTFPESPA